jgi:hypothetical protein
MLSGVGWWFVDGVKCQLQTTGRRKEGDWHHCAVTLPPKGETLPETLFRLWEPTARGFSEKSESAFILAFSINGE